MNNDVIMSIFLSHDNLKDLRYENNTLYYNDQSVDMSSINLLEFYNSYSQLYVDQYIITPQDFFNIMKIHSKKIVTKQKTRNINEDLQKIALSYINKGR